MAHPSGSVNMVWDEARGCLIPEPMTTKTNNPDVILSQTSADLSQYGSCIKMPEGRFRLVNTLQSTFDVKKLHPDAQLPKVAKHGDLGYDLFALEDVILGRRQVTKVHTGIACNFPYGYGALIRDRSSVATKQQVFVVAGVIDQGYTGEIIVAFYNPSVVTVDPEPAFKKGDKIAQLILTPVIYFLVQEVDELQKTERGSDGFGSTGQ